MANTSTQWQVGDIIVIESDILTLPRFYKVLDIKNDQLIYTQMLTIVANPYEDILRPGEPIEGAIYMFSISKDGRLRDHHWEKHDSYKLNEYLYWNC